MSIENAQEAVTVRDVFSYTEKLSACWQEAVLPKRVYKRFFKIKKHCPNRMKKFTMYDLVMYVFKKEGIPLTNYTIINNTVTWCRRFL